MVLLVTVRVPEFDTPPPLSAAVFPEMVLLVTLSVPEFATPPPAPAAPPLTVVSCSVNSPVLFTANRRNSGAPLARVIVLPCPTIVSTLLITGSPVGP